MKPEPRKKKRRTATICVLSLVIVPATILCGPFVIHRMLRATTPDAVLSTRQDEWSQIVENEPEALNGPNREACLRYANDAYLWFRVRGLGDPGDADWIFLREWRALFQYFFTSRQGSRPPELGRS